MANTKKTTQAKKTTKKTTNTTRKRKKEETLAEKISIDVKALLLIALGSYITYCIFASDPGVVGIVLKDLTIKLFGTVGCFILSIVLIAHGLMILFKVKSVRENGRGYLLYLLGLNITLFFSLAEIKFDEDSFLNQAFWSKIWQYSSKGGYIGAGLARIFEETISGFSYVIVAIVIVVALMFLHSRTVTEEIEVGRQKIDEFATDRKEKKRLRSDELFAEFDEKTGKKIIKGRKNTNKITNEDDDYILDLFKEETPSREKASSPKKEKRPTISERFAFDKKVDDIVEEDILPEDVKEIKQDKKVRQENRKQIEETLENTTNGAVNQEKIKYVFPKESFLEKDKSAGSTESRNETLQKKKLLEDTLYQFGVEARVNNISIGPTVTRYELSLAPGVRVNKIANLADDLALALAAQSIRIEAPIPGKSAVGIEVPNKAKNTVRFHSIVTSKEFKSNTSPLAIALGKDLSGENIIMDISKMPHILIAGATGSGKSVCIHTIITSILYHSSPEDVKMILIDPKMVELKVYEHIPHMLIPVVTDPKYAANALNWAVNTMSERYKMFSQNGVRDISSYNSKMAKAGEAKMPRILIIIDELADLMMVAGKTVEAAICRLAQLARAAGIHLVLATQRPSVDVITGLIKANIPSRISFATSSSVDSRTIIDSPGAEKLLGKGDMLYYPVGESKPVRAQCAFITDEEIETIATFVSENTPQMLDNQVTKQIEVQVNGGDAIQVTGKEFGDELLPNAMEIAFEKGIISTSTIQRRLKIGYARAGRIIDEMEEKGFISGLDGSKPRKVLISAEEFYSLDEEEDK